MTGKSCAAWWIMAIAVGLAASGSCRNDGSAAAGAPEFEFDVWGSPPSREVYKLLGDQQVQRILLSIQETASSQGEIAESTRKEGPEVRDRLEQLLAFGLVDHQRGRWISNVPLYLEKDIRSAERLGLKYAGREAEILERALPRLADVYSRTDLHYRFTWERMAFIIAGAFCSDFCVIDRIPFLPENAAARLHPRLTKFDGTRWEITGFEKLPQRYPSLRWKFYQNVESRREEGGISRFGYYDPPERRKSPPDRPENWLGAESGKLVLLLADQPRTLNELAELSGIQQENVSEILAAMVSYMPPAVTQNSGVYSLNIPVLSAADLRLLLPELDNLGSEIFKTVVLPYNEERRLWGKGRRWSLPADTYVRDKALEILIEKGLLTPIPPPPVDWNFGVWGWRGFLRMHGEMSEQ